MKRILSSITIALVAAAALAGCGSTSTSDPGTSATFNNADVTFARAMIPHHEQAVVMATMAKTQASSPEVRQLATRIEVAQAPEIDTMNAWLKAWGKDDGSDSSSHDMGGMGDDEMMDDVNMPGMMSDADMSALDGSMGAAFDRMFLTMMIRHHEGAIEMARTEQQDGKNRDAIDLAERIEQAQTSEIDLMKSMLDS